MAGQEKQHVVVLGAGVTGLTSALFLAEAGYLVTIVAAHVPGDSSIEYTSPWAGAHWLPHSRANEPVICDWDVQTYDYWLEIVRQEDEDRKLPPSGLKQIDSYEFWDKSPDYDIWYAPHVEAFRGLSMDSKPIADVNKKAAPGAPKVACGAYYKAMSINVPRYLLYLQEQARTRGVQVIKARLAAADGDFSAALQEAEKLAQASGRSKPACFVNATGLGAKKLCGDEAMYPIRGQTVLVRGEASSTITRVGDGYRAYCIPRPGSGTTILGGTKEEGVWDETPDDTITEQILLHNSWQIPELLTAPGGGFEVISVQCGLRPARRGGPRMEKEVVGKRAVVHAYGHAGAGYQNSVGSARVVVGMVGESLAVKEAQAKL